MLPFFRQGVVLEDSLNGTNGLAGPTINALYGVDVELTRLTEGFRLVLSWMNAVNRTDITQAVSFTSMQGSAIV
jgi:hypothetical protein